MKFFHAALMLGALMFCSTSLKAEDVSLQLTNMLNAFLAGASVNDAAAHDRFWADDLIYTSSGGERITKSDIMEGVRASPAADDEPETVWSAENIIIHPYSDMAVVAFQLVGKQGETDGNVEVSNYLNTGTFLKRDGVWKVVAWQATKMPAPVTDQD